MKSKLIGLFVLVSLLLLACTKHPEQNNQQVLVKIADRQITTDEFLRRAEYTIRPRYARGNSNIDKKIVFNSLVAEKLIALDAGSQSPLLQNDRFKSYIQGRKEQAMRQWMFYQEGTKKVKLDPEEIQRVYRVAGRTYKVHYLSLNSKSKADSLVQLLRKENISLEQLIKSGNPEARVPEKEIKFDSPEVDAIHRALFSDTLSKGQFLGPIKIEPNFYMVMQVAGYTDRLAMTDRDIKQRINDVKEKLTQLKATDIYAKFVAKLMSGKRLDFNRNTFKEMIKFLKPIYFMDEKQKKELFLGQLFKHNPELPDSFNFEDQYQKLKSLPFFTYEGQTWTVEQFMNELEKHPLVFRRRRFSPAEFPEQLRLAIADLLRDREITKVAYQKGYDRVPSVVQYTQMWQDALLAQFQIEQYLKEHGVSKTDSLNSVKIIQQYLEPYVGQLREKYKDQIEVNVAAFDSLKLTRIDMFAWQTNVPFPIIVPAFPQVTMYHRLDYGQPMPGTEIKRKAKP